MLESALMRYVMMCLGVVLACLIAGMGVSLYYFLGVVQLVVFWPMWLGLSVPSVWACFSFKTETTVRREHAQAQDTSSSQREINSRMALELQQVKEVSSQESDPRTP